MSLDPKVLSEVSTNIQNSINTDKIILFGSYARGQETPDSDLDLLIVTNKSFNKNLTRRQQLAKIRRSLSYLKMPKDLLLYTHDEFKEWQHSKNHIIHHALKEGRLLYERS